MNGEHSIRVVIGILRDGELGYRDFAASLMNPRARAFFFEESRVRAVFAVELERVLRELTGADRVSNGASLGTLHRSWVELQIALRGTDRTILETTERCEQYAVAGYDASLADKDVPQMALLVLQRQARHIRRALGIVRKYLEEGDEGPGNREGRSVEGLLDQDAG